MDKLKNCDWYQILCESLYASNRFRNMGCEVLFYNKRINPVKFEGIHGETPNFLSKNHDNTNEIKNPQQFSGIIKIKKDDVVIVINDKYFEEYKLIQDNITDAYYIINILVELLPNGEKKLISIRDGYFNKNIFSYKLIEILKYISLIDWDFHDIEHLPNENNLNENILMMTKGMRR